MFYIIVRLVVSELIEEKVSQVSQKRCRKEKEEEVEEEDGYFSTYSHFSIHEEMLKVRTYVHVRTY